MKPPSFGILERWRAAIGVALAGAILLCGQAVPAAAELTIGREGVEQSAAESRRFFQVTSNSAWGWETDVEWISTNEPIEQFGTQLFGYVAAENSDGATRTGTIVFTDGEVSHSHTVTQKGMPASPAAQPRPAVDAVDVNVQPALSWEPGKHAATFHLFVGRTSNLKFRDYVTSLPSRAGSALSVGPLDPETTYFWRVDSENAGGSLTPGTVWHFTTQTAETSDADSFEISQVELGKDNQFTLRWMSEEGEKFVVEINDSLQGDWTTLTGETIIAEGEETSLTFPIRLTGKSRWYRVVKPVKLSLPPPEVSGVSPLPVLPLDEDQTVTIHGGGFVSGVSLTVENPSGEISPIAPESLMFLSSGRLEFDFNNEGVTGAWRLRLENPDGKSSGKFEVFVRDDTPTGLPNLVPQNIILSSDSAELGDSITVTWDLFNSGDADAAATITRIQLNQSSTGPGGIELGSVETSPVTAGDTTKQSLRFGIPKSAAAGAHYVWIIVDKTGAVVQSNREDDIQRSDTLFVDVSGG